MTIDGFCRIITPIQIFGKLAEKQGRKAIGSKPKGMTAGCKKSMFFLPLFRVPICRAGKHSLFTEGCHCDFTMAAFVLFNLEKKRCLNREEGGDT